MKSLLFSISFILFVSAEQDLSTSLQNLGKAALSTDKDLDIDKMVGIAKKVSNLEHLGDLESLTKLDPMDFPVVGEGEYLLKEKCLQNGHNQSYDEVLALRTRVDWQSKRTRLKLKTVSRKTRQVITGRSSVHGSTRSRTISLRRVYFSVISSLSTEKQAQTKLGSCIMKFVKPEEMTKEIEEAKPKGELDEVFKKYCRQTPELKECVKNFTNTMGQCLSEKEQETKEVVINVTSSIINFICFKEGDRIALFIAEGGPECLTSNVERIMDCVNATMFKYVPEENDENSTLPELVIKKQHCDDMMEIQKCVVKVLEKCNEPTPANIVESMFKFVRKSTPCYNFDMKSEAGTNTLYSSLSLVTLILTSQLLTRL